MISTRSLIIQFIFVFFFFSRGSAATYFVNVNNVTPGAGTSWATAFTDLNSALGIVAPGDQVWVAAGTYKPSNLTGRNATFYIGKGGYIYGGFNGTETALSQQNPTANPTILSGDIGVVGDATDNCYHVVTYATVGTSGVILDGFTIRDGNANMGYPGSTVASSSNMGGGFLELSLAGQFESATISHCVFTNNFAVWGGGFGAYGDAASTFYGIKYCQFSNNAGFSGGGVASVGVNNTWSVSNIDMCVFTNNTGGQASAIATKDDNATSNNMLTMVTNCVLYDNAAPQLYNLATSASGNLQMYCSIVWSSTGPYASALYTGNNILLDYCDLDVASAGSGNFNSDPQFTNAAAGDFHIPHCSPLIDQGFTVSAFNIGATDPDGNARLIGPKTDIGLYESRLPPAPPGTDVSYCQYATAVPLQATALSGYSLLWYTGSSGGTGSSTAITPSTVSSSAYPYYYYVSQVDPQGCEGVRGYVKVTVSAAASAPVASSPTLCEGTSAVALTATGTNLLWYTGALGGTGDASAPVPSTAVSGSIDYYVTQTPGGSCESARTKVTVTIGAAAAAPVAGSPAYCQGASATALGATGSNLLWYSTVGGASSSTAPTPSTAGIGSTDYYVTQTPAGSCESSPTKVTVTINGVATSPAVSAVSYCEGAAAAALGATGTNLLWYNTVGGVSSSSAPTPSTAAAGSTDYYVTQTPAGYCESSPATLTVTIKAGASAPAVSAVAYCEGVAAAALGASGTNLLWYTDAAGGAGNVVAPTPSTVSAGTTAYYVSQTPAVGGCESPRAELDVTVKPMPSSDFSWSAACVGRNTAIKALVNSADLDYSWDFGNAVSSSGSDAGPYEVVWTNTNVYTVTLTTKKDGCQGQTQHSIAVNALPMVGINPLSASVCQGNTVTLEAYGASDYQWSPATDLSNAGSASPVATVEGSIQYTVTGTDVNGCSASASVQVEITPDCLVYYLPNAFTPNGDGKNDEFRVKTSDVPKSFDLAIYNRYGARVFESVNAGIGWNGMIGGSPAPAGTYVYTFQAVSSAGVAVRKQGTIVLVR